MVLPASPSTSLTKRTSAADCKWWRTTRPARIRQNEHDMVPHSMARNAHTTPLRHYSIPHPTPHHLTRTTTPLHRPPHCVPPYYHSTPPPTSSHRAAKHCNPSQLNSHLLTKLHQTAPHLTPHHLTSSHTTSHHFHDISPHTTSPHTTSPHTTSLHATSPHTTSPRTTSALTPSHLTLPRFTSPRKRLRNSPTYNTTSPLRTCTNETAMKSTAWGTAKFFRSSMSFG